MTDTFEIPETGEIDNKLLVSMFRDVRREQREIKDLLVALSKHILEVAQRRD